LFGRLNHGLLPPLLLVRENEITKFLGLSLGGTGGRRACSDFLTFRRNGCLGMAQSLSFQTSATLVKDKDNTSLP
jgi:hypothetical protein